MNLHRVKFIAGVLAALAATHLHAAAVPSPARDDWQKECARVRDVQIPAPDRPSAAGIKALASCEAQDLYYDARSAADWQKARHCAISQDEPATLMMIYANGKGVARNFDLALKYACAMNGAPAEMSGRIAHLLELKRGGGKDDFDQCDDITSGMMAGFCASIGENRDRKTRDARLKAIVAKWPEAQRAALAKLQKVFDEYVTLTSDHEVDQSGTARGAFVVEARAAELDGFLKTIESLEQGKLPAHDTAAMQALDRQLNDAYKRIMSAKDLEKRSVLGTVTQNGIRQTQRAWIKYRDAWVSFGKVRYPAVPDSAWQALLTERRLVALKAIEAELPK